ncbi:Alpha/beta hydrolase family protein [Burkholderiales bacterium 8X]|nr:Alpha/beta hydrolase family protein [Burkholderiales bacterium 8X]
MAARLQQSIVFLLAASMVAWVMAWWERSVVVALCGVVAIGLGHVPILALEMFVGYRVSRDDPRGRAGFGARLRACCAEAWYSVRVFCWQQPFRSRAVPDHLPRRPARGVVFVHGFLCNRGFWNGWMGELRHADRAFAAVDLEPMLGSIDDYAAIVDEAVRRVGIATGKPPLVIAHSMGGLAVRARSVRPGAAPIHRLVTIGTPHGGTWLAQFSSTLTGRQMAIGGEWLLKLGVHELEAPTPPLTAWYSPSDNVVFPTSTATLPHADNRCAGALGHIEMAFDARLRRETLALLDNDPAPEQCDRLQPVQNPP